MIPNQLGQALFETILHRDQCCRLAAKAAGAEFYILDVQGSWACYEDTARRINTLVGSKGKWSFSTIESNPNRPIPQATCVHRHLWQAIEELTQFGAVAIIDVRPGAVERSWEHYAVAVVQKKGTGTPQGEISDDQIIDWGDRNNIDAKFSAVKIAFEDARTLQPITEDDAV